MDLSRESGKEREKREPPHRCFRDVNVQLSERITRGIALVFEERREPEIANRENRLPQLHERFGEHRTSHLLRATWAKRVHSRDDCTNREYPASHGVPLPALI